METNINKITSIQILFNTIMIMKSNCWLKLLLTNLQGKIQSAWYQFHLSKSGLTVLKGKSRTCHQVVP